MKNTMKKYIKSQNISIKKWEENKLQNILRNVDIDLHKREKHSNKHNKKRKKNISIDVSPTNKLLNKIKSNKK